MMEGGALPGWSWFESTFPWLRGAMAIVLLALLFFPDGLRTDFGQPRWRDPSWLSWMGTVAYLLHNVEEYGIDLFGRLHGFPQDLVDVMGLPPYAPAVCL